jgi:nicotinamidase/pyrazinamidase
VDEVVIVGLATDYCVKFTALDAVRLGYKVKVLEKGCRGITVEGVGKAMEEMEAAGVEVEHEH